MVNKEHDIDDKFEKLDKTHIAIAGALSGFTTRGITQPFDVLKIRFQLQVEPISKLITSKYTSFPQAVKLIAREEGIRSFWKGHVPAQFLSVTFGITQFCCFGIFIKHAKEFEKNVSKPFIEFGAGSASGVCATVASYPFDTVRTRLVAQSENHKVYSGVLHAFGQIARNEGFLTFYKGLMPTVIAVAPNAGGQFMFYRLFDRTYRSIVNVDEDSFSLVGSLISGSLAGLISKSILYPFDLTRKRMQIQGFQKHRMQFGKPFVCGGLADCLYKIYKNEGFLGLFKGITPSAYKALTTSALNFTIFEKICHLMSHHILP